MSGIRLFRVAAGEVTAIPSTTDSIEKSLQILIERNLEEFLGVRFLASEYATTKSHGGRIDTLGIDETNNPVIVEYKRALNENVINQGLFYLNWLVDHRADFQLLVMRRLGNDVADRIEWRYPRLVCIAGDFTRYDEHAIQQIPQNIDLIRYRRYGDDLILLEQIATSSVLPQRDADRPAKIKEGSSGVGALPMVMQRLNQSSQQLQDRYHRLRAFTLGLGEGVEERTLEWYVAFRQVRNFAEFRFRPKSDRVVIYVRLDPQRVSMEPGFTSESNDGWVKIDVDSDEDVERAQPLIAMSYQES